jgi:hypothetical protein
MNQEVSVVTHAQHTLIHAEIAAIGIALAGAEQYANRTVGGKRSGAVLRIAQTEAGRASIANALDLAYFYGGWWNKGSRSIKDVFESERGSFVAGTNTSLPWCTRTGMP